VLLIRRPDKNLNSSGDDPISTKLLKQQFRFPLEFDIVQYDSKMLSGL